MDIMTVFNCLILLYSNTFCSRGVKQVFEVFPLINPITSGALNNEAFISSLLQTAALHKLSDFLIHGQ